MLKRKPISDWYSVDWQAKARYWLNRLSHKLFGNHLKWERVRQGARNNFELGRRHFRLGNMQDAIFRLRIATWLDPQNGESWFYLGRSYLAENKKTKAAEAFKKAAELSPSDEGNYLLAISGVKPAGGVPRFMPVSLATEHFDAIAAGFTQSQADAQYRGPTMLAQAMRLHLTPGRVDNIVLEIGVGTGLLGKELRTVSGHSTGVDISSAMLDQAMLAVTSDNRRAYDALLKREAQEFLRSTESASFDIVAGLSTLSYIGELTSIFADIHRVLKPKGVFAFTADIAQGESYRLDAAAGRFRFSKPYLESLIAQTGFSICTLEEAMIYPDYGMWLCVLQK